MSGGVLTVDRIHPRPFLLLHRRLDYRIYLREVMLVQICPGQVNFDLESPAQRYCGNICETLRPDPGVTAFGLHERHQ